VFGSSVAVAPEKAVLANASAVREWDSNGTVFGYHAGDSRRQAGEFGHNDYYPVVIAACQQRGLDGAQALRGMVLVDEIRGRLAEVFSLKSYKIDHGTKTSRSLKSYSSNFGSFADSKVVHGAIASAATYGAMMGASEQEIEYAIGMLVAHFIPWRAIRAGHQLSDSKGASAAFSAEAAVLCTKRAMAGFIGPADIFRNPEALFRQFEPTTSSATAEGDAPFDLTLSSSGDDFAVMGMHFKLGLYEVSGLQWAPNGVIDPDPWNY
jgi:2-methylcitrate dehydratase